LPTSTPTRPRGLLPPMTPARIEGVPPCAPSRKLACPRQAKALASRTPRKVRLRAQQSPCAGLRPAAPARRLDISSKSGAPRHKVRAVDTRARPACHVGNPSLLRCCGRRAGVALRREQSPCAGLRPAAVWPGHGPGQSSRAVEAMLTQRNLRG
jgi:hypothetical protein